MNRWHWLKNRVVVWSFYLIVGSMILYMGYKGSEYFIPQESILLTTIETEQAVAGHIAHEPEDQETGSISQTPTEEKTAEDQTSPGVKTLKDFPSPVQGSILRSVGNYYSEALDKYFFHAGIDYAEPEGTMIRATHGGKVIFSGEDPILGQKVTLDCGEGWLVTYAGLENLRVQVGETVEVQDALGQVGLFTVGENEIDQPHLHYGREKK